MSGVLMTRKKLKEALESARAKRQKLSGLRITLLDATEMELSESYGSSLQDLVTSRLLSGKTSGILPSFTPVHSTTSKGELPDMDMEPLSVGEDPMEEQMMDLPAEEQDNIEIREVEAEHAVPAYEEFVAEMKQKLEDSLVKEGERFISWNKYTTKNDRRTAATNFFHLLVAASKHDVEVHQNEAFGDILVSRDS